MHPSLCDCGERHQPKMTGMCCLPLKSVLQADNLFLDKTLEVKDRSQAAGHNTSLTQDKDWPLVGHLKVRMEPYVAVWHNGYMLLSCILVTICHEWLLQVGKPSQFVTSHLGQLGLAIPPRVQREWWEYTGTSCNGSKQVLHTIVRDGSLAWYP